MKENTTENTLLAAYLKSLSAEKRARAKAQQSGAWLIASMVATSEMTLDEAITAVRDELKKAGWPQSTINNSLPLVPFACSAYAAGEGVMPTAKQWPTKGHAENVLAVAGKTYSEAQGVWPQLSAAVEKEAVADLKADFKSDGLPDKVPTQEQVKLRVKSLARKAGDKKGASSAGLFDNLERLQEQVARLTDKQLDELEAMIESVRDKRNAIK